MSFEMVEKSQTENKGSERKKLFILPVFEIKIKCSLSETKGGMAGARVKDGGGGDTLCAPRRCRCVRI